MRKLYTFLLALLLIECAFAQAPSKMSYQAVIRNSSNQLVTSQVIGMRISIIQGSISGTNVYTEIQTPTTNANGLVSIEIGGGIGFNAIDWANGSYFIKTETDPTGGTNYTIVGTNQILSVPYALHSKTAETLSGGIAETDPLWTSSSANYYTKTNMQSSGTAALHFNNLTNKPTTLAGYGITDAGDNWGSQRVVTDATLTGNGITATPLKIAQQSATSGQVLKWSGTTWLPANDLTGGATATPGGSSGNIQFNNAGSFGGDAGLFWDNTNKRLGVGTSVPDNSAVVEITSNTKGLLIPRMTQANRNTIPSPANSLMIFQTDNTPGYYYNSGSSSSPFWKIVSGLTFPYSASVIQNDGYTFSLTSSGSTCIYSEGFNGVIGVTNSTYGFGSGIEGRASQTSGTYYGVEGTSSSSEGSGVYGLNWSTTGAAKGVYGETRSPSGHGISGRCTNASGYSGYFSGGKVYMSGDVGIGTLTPTANLSIVANSSISYPHLELKETGTDFARLMFRNGTSTTYHWTIAGCPNTTDNAARLNFYYEGVSGGKDLATLTGDGNLGIGTTLPSRMLTVKATSISSANFVNDFSGTTYGDGLMIGLSGATASLMNYETGSMVIGTSNLPRLAILAGGDVGIGTLTPLYKLDVAGDANLNKGIATGIALRVNGDEALWYNNTYFSWGYGAMYNVFSKPVGINCSPGNGDMLAVNGTASKPGGGTWAAFSDIRLKDVSGSYTRGLEDIIRLQPVKYRYKKGNELKLPSDIEYIGFVAQEVNNIFPEAITKTTDGYLQFDMHPVNVALVNAIKELKAENDILKMRLEKLETLMNLKAEK